MARPRHLAHSLFIVLLLTSPTGVASQSVLERTPNFYGTTVPSAKRADFTFLHRFELVGQENRKVVNFPTFVLGVGLPHQFGVGATYTTNSELGAGTPNEWELWLRKRFVATAGIDFSGMFAFNTASQSADGEFTARFRVSRLAFLGTTRAFSDAFGLGEAEAAVGGGALLYLTPRLALAADVARVVTTDVFPSAWSAGVSVAIPSSPHTFSFVVSNVGATTLEGASRGVEELDGDAAVRYGFGFTLPLGTFSQWGQIFHGPDESDEENVVRIQEFAFGPVEIRIDSGETVHWINDDSVAHTVTSDDELFDSGLLAQGEGYSRKFDAPGRYAYHCAPHPFMTAVVVVEEASKSQS